MENSKANTTNSVVAYQNHEDHQINEPKFNDTLKTNLRYDQNDQRE